jgi:hypothetical protein
MNIIMKQLLEFLKQIIYVKESTIHSLLKILNIFLQFANISQKIQKTLFGKECQNCKNAEEKLKEVIKEVELKKCLNQNESQEMRNYQQEYERYQGTTKQKKRRAIRNHDRREAIRKYGEETLKGKDIDHKNKRELTKPHMRKIKSNRSDNKHHKGEKQKRN